MIKNFEELKKQLAELADVINTLRHETIPSLKTVAVMFDPEVQGGAPKRASRDCVRRRCYADG